MPARDALDVLGMQSDSDRPTNALSYHSRRRRSSFDLEQQPKALLFEHSLSSTFCVIFLIISFFSAFLFPSTHVFASLQSLSSQIIISSTLPPTLPTGPNADEIGPAHTEGDIKESHPSSSPHRRRRSVTSYEYKRWPNGIIPYELDPAYTAIQRTLLRRAMDGIEEHTCVKFVERSGSEADFVYVEAQDGCSSYVGRRGGRQIVSLQAWTCLSKIGVMMHELMHVVGFYHEHTRLDRDEFIRIDWPNIQGGREVNFKQREPGSIDNQGLSYDYGSVMHYSAYAFSKDPRIPTLLPSQTGVPLELLGQREKLSDLDIKKINALYKCGAHNKIPQSQEEHQPALQPPVHLYGRPLDNNAHGHPISKHFRSMVHRKTPATLPPIQLQPDPRFGQIPSSFFYPMPAKLINFEKSNDPCTPGFEPDAFINTAGGELLLVQNGHTWLVDANRQLHDVGKLQKHFEHAPHSIDGAFSYSNKFTFLFSNGHYWKYRGATLLKGYPQPIETGFPGLPMSSLDAAFQWGEKIIFVKGERYWTLHPYVDSSIRGPFNLHDTAIPMPVEAGFQDTSSRTSFVFARGLVFKLQTNALKVDLSSKQSLMTWLKCDLVVPLSPVNLML